MNKIHFFIFILFLPITVIKAQATLNTTGTTLKGTDISYAYSVGEVSGFSVQPYCMYTQGVIQPPKFSCAPVKYEYNKLYEIALYPNPTNGIIKIETNYPDFVAYRIFASDGRLVQSGKYNYAPLNLFAYPKGIYLLQLMSSDYKIKKTFKIIKQ